MGHRSDIHLKNWRCGQHGSATLMKGTHFWNTHDLYTGLLSLSAGVEDGLFPSFLQKSSVFLSHECLRCANCRFGDQPVG